MKRTFAQLEPSMGGMAEENQHQPDQHQAEQLPTKQIKLDAPATLPLNHTVAESTMSDTVMSTTTTHINTSVFSGSRGSILRALHGVSKQFCHVRTITSSLPSVTIDQHDLMSLYYHFPGVTQLECTIDVNRFDTVTPSASSSSSSSSATSSSPSLPTSLHSFPSLRLLNLRLTLRVKQKCSSVCCSPKEDNDVLVWHKVRTPLEYSIASHLRTLTSISLEYDLFEDHAQWLNKWQLETLNQLPSPLQLTHLSITATRNLGFEVNRGFHSWSNSDIQLIRSFKNLTSLSLPQMRYPDAVKLFARPIPWRRLKLLHTQGGLHELERMLQNSHEKSGWPRQMPIFVHSAPLSHNFLVDPDTGQAVEIVVADMFPIPGKATFQGGWADE